MLLGEYSGMPGIQSIEIGCYEGRSTLWFLRNVLTHDLSRITCIDPWLKEGFYSNVVAYAHKINVIRELSQVALRNPSLRQNSFHFIYIDGDHRAPAVLEDAVLSFSLLRPGGIMIFDDYKWQSNQPRMSYTMPKIAIDSFLNVYASQYKLLYHDARVAVRKI